MYLFYNSCSNYSDWFLLDKQNLKKHLCELKHLKQNLNQISIQHSRGHFVFFFRIEKGNIFSKEKRGKIWNMHYYSLSLPLSLLYHICLEEYWLYWILLNLHLLSHFDLVGQINIWNWRNGTAFKWMKIDCRVLQWYLIVIY